MERYSGWFKQLRENSQAQQCCGGYGHSSRDYHPSRKIAVQCLHRTNRSEPYKYLSVIANCILFLACQGIALRDDSEEEDGNFMQLVKLRSSDNPELRKWLDRKKKKYTSPDIQNELLRIMGLTVLRDMASCVKQNTFFTLMADEVADVSNKEKMAICLRSVDDDSQPYEEWKSLLVCTLSTR